jgi:hypothetical protein
MEGASPECLPVANGPPIDGSDPHSASDVIGDKQAFRRFKTENFEVVY